MYSRILKSETVYVASIFSEWRGWYVIKFYWNDSLPTYTLYDDNNCARVSSGSLNYILGWIG